MSFLKFIRLLYVPVHILSFSLRIRTVYEFRTLVRVHKQYGFRPRRSGYGSDKVLMRGALTGPIMEIVSL